jgi:hypothetical protein
MKRTQEEKLLNPKPGGKIAEAQAYGVDLTQLAANLRLTPAQRIRKNDNAANSLRRFRQAMKRAKSRTEPSPNERSV